jgi:hypothetical protein
MAMIEELPLSVLRGRLKMPSLPAIRCLMLPSLLALAAACYWRVLFTFFVQDDFFFLTAVKAPMPNAYMLRGRVLFRPLSSYWMPLLNYSVWGLDPFWHHLTYFVLFLATIALLHHWLREATGSNVAALAGASLYAFSKTHLYTLAWIAGGIDVLAGLFSVLTLWAVSRYCRRCEAGDGNAGRWRLLLVALALCCALLSKESGVVLAPACLAWMVVRTLMRRRRPCSAEWKLAVLLISMTIAYGCLWVATTPSRSGSQMQINPMRAGTVLRHSVIALVPLAEETVDQGNLWLLLPLAAAALVAADCWKRRQRLDYLALSLVLWVLSASIFVFTTYPSAFQLYHSHFSVIGLSILAALAVRSIRDHVANWREGVVSGKWPRRWAPVAVAIGLVLYGTWIGLASHTIRSGIDRQASPALHEAGLSRLAYDQLDANLRLNQYQRVVLLEQRGLVWSAMHGTAMASLFFPDVTVDCVKDDRSGASEMPRTSSTTLVMRVSKNGGLTIVR